MNCQGWAETKAAYQFFDNPKVEPRKILLPHRKATERRALRHSGNSLPCLLSWEVTTIERASDDPPGPQVLWVGMRRMLEFSIAWTAFGPEAKKRMTYV